MRSALPATAVVTLVLATGGIGCARTPVTTAMAPPPPAVSSTSPRGQVQAGAVAIDRGDGFGAVAERPQPSAFAQDAHVKAVFFDFDRYDIRLGDARTLEADAAWLKTNDVLILIEGQCDDRGTSEYNLALGDRRAQAARNYLIAQGVAASRIATVSYGKERPICAQHTEACWAMNRRAHLVVKPRG